MLQVGVNISLEKFCCRKKTWGYAKEKNEKNKEKKLKNMDTKMSGVLKTMGTKMPTMKKTEIAPDLANISSFYKGDMFQGTL